MGHDFDRTLDDLTEIVRRAKDRGDGVVILLGAGCSKTSGIPLAAEFCDLIRKGWPREYERARRDGRADYQHLMAQLPPGERRDLLARYIDRAKMNWAHISLAKLIEEGYVARVLTPNFDPLVVQACALLNVFPAIYDFAASQTFKPDYVPTPAVYYLHGQRSGFRLLNTERECAAHAEQLRPVFEEAGARRPWLVIGYSGENDPVFEHLLAGRTFDYGLYWIGYRDAEPGRHLAEGLLRDDRHAYYVRGFDADSFFIQLADRLGCFPPDLVSRPFTHLTSTFGLIGAYDHRDRQGNSVDLLAQAREMVQRAIEAFEQRALEPMTDEDVLTRVRALFMSESYEAAVRLAEQVVKPSKELRELLSWVYNGWGNALTEQGKQSEGAERERLLGEACAKYAAALEVKPDKHEALHNWGLALYEQARRKEGPEAVQLFEAAGAKYAVAVEVKPDKVKALNNWGLALTEQGKRSEGARRERLFAEAERRLQRVVERAPAEGYNLACLYALQGRAGEARPLLLRAKEAGTLPPKAHLLSDPDLASLREEPWFTALMDGAVLPG